MQRSKPPFRADHVGSLLRPAALRDARAKHARAEISSAELTAIEDREIERIVRKQEESGLKSITDGEFRRSWWHLDFLWGLDGVERYAMDRGMAFAGMQTRAEGARIVGELGHPGRYDDHDASLPRQLPLHPYGQRRLRRGRGRVVQPDQGARLFHGV